MGEVRELRQELSQRDQAVEIQRSNSLVEASSQLAQTVVNAAAVETSLRNQTKESEIAHERQRLETQAQLESLAAPITILEGRVKSSNTLMSERSNEVLDQVAAAEGRQQKLDAQMQKLEGRTDAIGNPITRAEVQGLITDAVASQWREQQEAITDAVVKDIQTEFPQGVFGQRLDGDYVRQQETDAANRNERMFSGGQR